METIKVPQLTKFKGAITSGVVLLSVIFDLIVLSLPVASEKSAWATAGVWVENSNFVPAGCFLLILLFCINVIALIVGVILSLIKKTALWPCFIAFCSQTLMLAINHSFSVKANSVFMIMSFVVTAMGGLFALACAIMSKNKGDKINAFKKGLICIGIISVLIVFAILYIPVCTYWLPEGPVSVLPMGAFSSSADRVLSLGLFVGVFLFGVLSLTKLVSALKNYSVNDNQFAEKTKNLVSLNTVAAGVYFALGVIICSASSSKSGILHTTISYIPLVLMSVMAIVCALFTRKVLRVDEKPMEKTAKRARTEFLIYSTIAAVVTIVAAFSDIIKVHFTRPSHIEDIMLNGYEILMNYNSIESGFQLAAFAIFAVVAIIATLIIATIVSYISKSKFFFKIALAELVCSAACSLLIGFFGKYYEIVQGMNQELLKDTVGSMIDENIFTFDFVVESQALYWFVVVLAIVVVALIRKPYSKGATGEATFSIEGVSGSTGGSSTTPAEPVFNAPATFENDPCPAFSELDAKAEAFRSEEQRRAGTAFKNVTLPELVKFVVDYARDSRLHLSYTNEDIACFIAGLGATRLTILQGMSGTGKTSLPKIFSEAIFGNCDIIEVESSWRDKNELLGYYNEFSKTYTPKKFTQALYKAKLNPNTVTFIVLDEMNLSRIEYYFSDFLSLMEHEEDKREIKLLGVGLRRTQNGISYGYSALTDGHTLKVPNNIWFIGTANRDESTFEISDKVYDRAHTMNFNKRAKKPMTFAEPQNPRFVSVEEFTELLEKARKTVKFNIDNYPLIKEVEQLLEPYNISFGNRIANQIEAFVSIYCSCFESPESVAFDAVEKILLSKVVSKLEFKSVENKTRLAAEFEKRKLHRCSEFILKLNED